MFASQKAIVPQDENDSEQKPEEKKHKSKEKTKPKKVVENEAVDNEDEAGAKKEEAPPPKKRKQGKKKKTVVIEVDDDDDDDTDEEEDAPPPKKNPKKHKKKNVKKVAKDVSDDEEESEEEAPPPKEISKKKKKDKKKKSKSDGEEPSPSKQNLTRPDTRSQNDIPTIYPVSATIELAANPRFTWTSETASQNAQQATDPTQSSSLWNLNEFTYPRVPRPIPGAVMPVQANEVREIPPEYLNCNVAYGNLNSTRPYMVPGLGPAYFEARKIDRAQRPNTNDLLALQRTFLKSAALRQTVLKL